MGEGWITLAVNNGKDGIVMATKSKDNLELVYQNSDWDGNVFKIWKGKSLKLYPPDIAAKDAVFYLETDGLYRFTLSDQHKMVELVLQIVARRERQLEKANGFIAVIKKVLEDTKKEAKQ